MTKKEANNYICEWVNIVTQKRKYKNVFVIDATETDLKIENAKEKKKVLKLSTIISIEKFC